MLIPLQEVLSCFFPVTLPPHAGKPLVLFLLRADLLNEEEPKWDPQSVPFYPPGLLCPPPGCLPFPKAVLVVR